MCLIPLQYLWVRAELYLANKLIEKTISGRVQLARYINAPMTLRYDTLGPSNYCFTSSERTTIEELQGCALSIQKCFKIFLVYADW